jgi:Gas vesicle protein G
MFLLDSLLIDGLRFVLDKVRAVAEAELKDDTVLRERLLEAQMRLELGELTAEEFAEIERDVFDRLRELRGPQPAPISMASRDAKVTVEASVADDVK